jgi:hypothetical protein
MSSLHRAGRAHIQPAAPTIAGAGGWGTVASYKDGQVRVTFAEFDGGVAAFGPLPCWLVSGDPPDVGDQVWLLVDTQGEPQLALAA